MPARRHTRESVIETLKNLAHDIGRNKLTTRDIARVLPTSSVSRLFGNVGNALEAAGLERTGLGENLKDVRRCITDDDLFNSLLVVERQLGHEPKRNHYTSAGGRYSTRPFTRFGHWPEVLARFRKWKVENVADGTNRNGEVPEPFDQSPGFQTSVSARKIGTPLQLYGEPIDFRGLRHAPINEQGVVYLFGMISRELGFYIEAIQQGFPDCEGKYLHDAKKKLWAKARIEFEFRASTFCEHGHDANQCDFIVCWINDWPDCPIPVIELKSELLKLPAR